MAEAASDSIHVALKAGEGRRQNGGDRKLILTDSKA